MLIKHSTPDDLDNIFLLFGEAIAYQKTKFSKHWLGFDRELIRQEIEEKRHWKITIAGQTAVIFSVTYEDPQIWGKKSRDPALYIHRIATSSLFRGQGFFKQIITWAKAYARAQGKNFIRMDTWADNQNLINYYLSFGFNYLGIKQLGAHTDLPIHYAGNDLSLFEIDLSNIHFSMSKPPTTLEKLGAYNLWANEVLVHWLEEMSDLVPSHTLHLLSHISNAQLIWLSRIENMSHAYGVFEEHTLKECREMLSNSSDQLLELAAMPAVGLAQVISYTNTKGEVFETTVEDILIHVFNHGTYHRAQVARDLRQNFLSPVNTDYITYVRALAIPTE